MANPYARRAIVAARMASAIVALAAAAILAGWLLDISGLTSLYLPGPTLKTNAAVGLMCAALANLVFMSARGRVSRLAGYALATVPTVLGALTVSEHLAGWDLGIDQLIATEPEGAAATISPNRMGPPASAANLLLGAALFLGESGVARRRRLCHLLASVTFLITVLPVMGYAYGFDHLYGVARYTGISMANSIGLLLLSCAVQAGRPDRGLAALMCREG